MFALFRPELKQLVAELGNVRGGDSNHAMTALGWTMRTPGTRECADTNK